MNLPLVLLAVALAPAGPGPNPGPVPFDTLTVLQCAALAAQHAPEVLAARAEAMVASYDSGATAGNARPRLALDGGALIAPQGFYDPTATNLGEYHAKVVLELPLTDGGARRRARESAGLTAQGAGLDAAMAAREVQLRAIAVALDLVRTDELRAAQADAEAWLDDLAQLVDAGVRSGSRGRADAVRVSIEHDVAASAELASAGARGALARELATLIGRPGDTAIAVRRPDADGGPPAAPVDSAALLTRQDSLPDVKRATTDEALRRIAIEDAQKSKAIEIGFIADAGLWGTGLTRAVPVDMLASNPNATFGDRLRRDLGASVAFEFRRPLTDPARSATTLARTASLEASRLRREALIASHRRAALDLLARGRTAAAQLELAQASAARAEDNVLRARSLYAGGGASLLEVLDARRQLDDARARLVDARFEVMRARYEAEVL